jgi:hypothetical protein
MVASDTSPCLALFDATTLERTRTACVPAIIVGPRPSVSPDGRWLFVHQVADGAPEYLALDLPAGGPAPVVPVVDLRR